MSSSYCGIKSPPKGKEPGTMKECAESNQVRKYGLYKVDKLLVSEAPKSKLTRKDRDEQVHKVNRIRYKYQRIKKEYQKKKDDKKAKEFKKLVLEYKKELETLKDMERRLKI